MSAPAQEPQQQDVTPAVAADARQSIAGDDNLACQWEKCSERCTSAENLFVCPAPLYAPIPVSEDYPESGRKEVDLTLSRTTSVRSMSDGRAPTT